MSAKRKDREGPRKLAEFVGMYRTQGTKDGADSSFPHHSSEHNIADSDGEEETSSGQKWYSTPDTQNDLTSPLKQKRRISSAEGNNPSLEDKHPAHINPYDEKLNAIPTAGQPILDSTIKDMIISLRGALQYDMMNFMQKSKMEMDALGERVDYVENKMCEFTSAHNEMVDSHFELEDEVKHLKTKIADLEDRARRNNVKFRGIPENVKPPELKRFIKDMIKKLLPTIPQQELEIDRAHRLPKPSHISEKLPRDVIARIHFFEVKDQLMQFARRNSPLPDPYTGIILYADLSQATILARKNLNSITKILRNHSMIYKWGFPTKILVDHKGTSYSINNLEQGLKILRSWGILPKEDNIPDKSTPGKVSQDWQKSHR